MQVSEKDQWLQVRETELPITLRVLKAFPANNIDYRPHPKSRSARELAWVFVMEEGILGMMIKGKMDFSGAPPPIPQTIAEIIAMYEQVNQQNNEMVKKLSDAEMNAVDIDWLAGPRQPIKMRRGDAFWVPVLDAIHHRGQLSVYIRPAGGKVPSIYGPTAEEPWM